MFNFKVYSEEELAKKNLLEKGEYPFHVESVIQKKSEKGNDMLELKLAVYSGDDKHRLVYDYLMDGMFEFKIRHFCYSVGMGDEYEMGCVDPQKMVGRRGIAKIFIKEDKKGMYAPRNAVADYLKPEISNVEVKKEEELNDVIPF